MAKNTNITESDLFNFVFFYEILPQKKRKYIEKNEDREGRPSPPTFTFDGKVDIIANIDDSGLNGTRHGTLLALVM